MGHDGGRVGMNTASISSVISSYESHLWVSNNMIVDLGGAGPEEEDDPMSKVSHIPGMLGSLVGPVDPPFRARSGPLQYTARRHQFNKNMLLWGLQARRRRMIPWRR